MKLWGNNGSSWNVRSGVDEKVSFYIKWFFIHIEKCVIIRSSCKWQKSNSCSLQQKPTLKPEGAFGPEKLHFGSQDSVWNNTYTCVWGQKLNHLRVRGGRSAQRVHSTFAPAPAPTASWRGLWSLWHLRKECWIKYGNVTLISGSVLFTPSKKLKIFNAA